MTVNSRPAPHYVPILIGVVLIILHAWWPQLKIDWVTIALFVVFTVASLVTGPRPS